MVATAFDYYYPFATGQGIESADDWSAIARLFTRDGVANTGVASYDLNKLAVTADGGGMYVKVASGRVQVKGFHGRRDTQATLAIAAAHATLGRIDRVVARVTWATGVIALDVLTGTPNATPSLGLAGLTQSDGTVWEVELAQVSVAAATSAISAGAVTDLRPYVAGWVPTGTIGYTELAAGAATVRYAADGVGTDSTTSSASFVAMAQMSITFTAVAGAWHQIMFDAEAANNTAGNLCRPAVYLDGAFVTALAGFQSDSANQLGRIGGHHTLTGLAAGSHTIEIRWAVSTTGTGTVQATRKLTVIEHRR